MQPSGELGDPAHAGVGARVGDAGPEVGGGFGELAPATGSILGLLWSGVPQAGAGGQVGVQEQLTDAAAIDRRLGAAHAPSSPIRSQIATMISEAPRGRSSMGWRLVAASAVRIRTIDDAAAGGGI